MFKNLTDFSFKRNWKEAIGFYLAFLVLGVLIGGIVGGIYGILAAGAKDAFDGGLTAGALVGITYCLVISIMLLKEKKLYKNFGYIFLTVVGVLLAALTGSLLGLIVPAFMTTRESRK